MSILSISIATGLILYDAVIFGSFYASLIVVPLWIIVSIIKSLVIRSSIKAALVRMLMPAGVFLFIQLNHLAQLQIAVFNSKIVIEAVEKYYNKEQRYPNKLDELVPNFLSSIPKAKYCLFMCDFVYFYHDNNKSTLLWIDVFPFGRRYYDFETKSYKYMD